MSKYRLPAKPAPDAPHMTWARYHSAAAVVHANRAVLAASVSFAIALFALVVRILAAVIA